MAGRFNPAVGRITPYQGGKPIGELARELGLTDIVKLASNENPRGPGETVIEAIEAASRELTRYPDGNGFTLKSALSERLNVAPNQITLGAGSNEVIDLLARAVLTPGDEVVVSEHTFIAHVLAVYANGGELVTAKAANYGADPDAMLAAITPRTRIVMLANPNNPTGTYWSAETLDAFIDRLPGDVWLLIDEAYFEYVAMADYPNAMTRLMRCPNLIVTRTFSKIHGLASLRIGYGVCSPELADRLNRARLPFNTNSFGQAAAVAALADEDYAADSRELNVAELGSVKHALKHMAVDFIPSVGNFLTTLLPFEGAQVYERMLHRGVIVRPVAEYGLPNALRISIGLPDENKRCMAALKDVLAELSIEQSGG